ncbi:MAG TPA: cupredoxin domain-containing protein [Thermomicrobiales bacterium]|nr:cupredoxin domain-containing protein [Thermomicrobiales bacterium]
MTTLRNGLGLLLRASVLLMLAASLVACGDEDEVATDQDAVPAASAEGVDELPEGLEAAILEIEDGEFDEDELTLQQGEPTVLQIVNGDDRPYEFLIEDLVAVQSIPAGTTAQIEFTTPNPGDYAGLLLDPEDESVVSEVTVTVQDAGGLQ